MHFFQSVRVQINSFVVIAAGSNDAPWKNGSFAGIFFAIRASLTRSANWRMPLSIPGFALRSCSGSSMAHPSAPVWW